VANLLAPIYTNTRIRENAKTSPTKTRQQKRKSIIQNRSTKFDAREAKLERRLAALEQQQQEQQRRLEEEQQLGEKRQRQDSVHGPGMIPGLRPLVHDGDHGLQSELLRGAMGGPAFTCGVGAYGWTGDSERRDDNEPKEAQTRSDFFWDALQSMFATQEAAVAGFAAHFNATDPKQLNEVAHPSFARNLLYLCYVEQYPVGSDAGTACMSASYPQFLHGAWMDPMTVYRKTQYRFELLPSHFFACVRGLLGNLVLGSFRNVRLPDLMSRPSKLTFPVKLEKHPAPPVRDENEAAQCGRNLAAFLRRAFNPVLGDAFLRMTEYCEWLVLNFASFTWQDHVRVLEEALRRVDGNTVRSATAVAQKAWAVGERLMTGSLTLAALQQLKRVALSDPSILTRPEDGLDPEDENGVIKKWRAAKAFKLEDTLSRLAISNMEKQGTAAAAPTSTSTGKGWSGPPGARAKGIQA